MGITRFVLRRPVTAVLCVLCLLVFGIISVRSSTLELSPEMDMSMMIVIARYSGASPEDVAELVTKEIEDSVSTLSGLKSISSTSSEGSSMIMLEYNYGTDMDEAYDDLKKKVDNLSNVLPDDVDTPTIMEMNNNSSASMRLSVNNPTADNLYNYVEENIVPEFEKISEVAEVTTRGGQEEYIKIELKPEKLAQYGLSMSTVASDIAAADLSYPSGEIKVGSQELSVTASEKFDTMESLNAIPLSTSGISIVYLEDVADIYMTTDSSSSLARYNGEDTLSISISKQQSATAMSVSEEVNSVIDSLMAADENLDIIVVSDTSESIMESLSSVFQTLIMAIVISMIVIFLFVGDLKGSLIVGSSIPISIMTALILMNMMDFSLNVITMSALVLGVGMMVDNSIVVLESCFRATKDKGFLEYNKAALDGSSFVIQSIIGSTVTTCVVFLPLAFLQGMTGQLFKPLGFTIVFCMMASLLSAMAIVPLCYMLYRPKEKDSAPLSGPITRLQNYYRSVMQVILPKKKTVVAISLALLCFSIFLGTKLQTELMASDDQGEISISIETRPGLLTENIDEIAKEIEAIIIECPDLESYITEFGGGGARNSSDASISAYLKSDRDMETDEVVSLWKEQLGGIQNCNISVSASSSMSMMSDRQQSYETLLQSTNYDDLKEVSDKIVKELSERPEVTKIHSSLENAAPVVKIEINPIKAKANGLTSATIGRTLNNILSGVEATTLEIDGEDVDVMVEFAEGEYETLDQVKNIILTTGNGGSVALTDVADVHFEDSPSSISRSDKQYRVTISGQYTDAAEENTRNVLTNEVVRTNLTSTVSTAINSRDRSMNEEFQSLFQAIAIAVFMIFVVMAAQFESPKFSIMVMITIPFSLIGSFGLLYLTNCKISMTSLLGFLMLIGTVVNNGILYVDTVNQYRAEMDIQTAIIEAGATRLRPILMTTLTTIVSMIPMAFAMGNSGSMTQGLAVVNIGGLIASTLLSLLLLPVYYSIMNSRKKEALPVLD